MQTLTERQAEVLKAIESHIRKTGLTPSIRELMPRLKLRSTRAVWDHLETLARKGYIRVHRERARGIQVLQSLEGRLPLIGEVAAGLPIEAVENVERYVNVPPEVFRRRPDYLLRVRGDSMVDAGIRDGDWIAIRKAHTADPGDIVIAMRDGDVTVKELAIEAGFVVLKPHNARLRPMRIPAGDVVVVGVYTGALIRPG